MAYIFPLNPVDGQLYPNPAIAGSLQYIWNQGQRAWLIYSPLGVQSVSGILPIKVTNNTDDPVVSILPATVSTPGSMSPEDKVKLDNLPAPTDIGTVKSIGAGTGLITDQASNAPITSTGFLSLRPPSGGAIGGVKAGLNVSIEVDGTINAANPGITELLAGNGLIASPNPVKTVGTIAVAPATRLNIGGVIVGQGLTVDGSGLLSLQTDVYTNMIAAWGNFANNPSALAPTFSLSEGYNISSIAYVGGAQPKAQVTFQNALPNTTYGVNTAVSTADYGASLSAAQVSNTMNFNFKGTQSIDLKVQSNVTLNNTASGGSLIWNTWITGSPTGNGCFAEFDLQIFDTRVF